METVVSSGDLGILKYGHYTEANNLYSSKESDSDRVVLWLSKWDLLVKALKCYGLKGIYALVISYSIKLNSITPFPCASKILNIAI